MCDVTCDVVFGSLFTTLCFIFIEITSADLRCLPLVMVRVDGSISARPVAVGVYNVSVVAVSEAQGFRRQRAHLFYFQVLYVGVFVHSCVCLRCVHVCVFGCMDVRMYGWAF